MPYEGEFDELIDRLLQIMRAAEKRGVQFSSKKLNEAGGYYERKGYNPARVYLASRGSEMEMVLVQILDEIHKKVSDPVLGGLILRRLDAILRLQEDEKKQKEKK